MKNSADKGANDASAVQIGCFRTILETEGEAGLIEYLKDVEEMRNSDDLKQVLTMDDKALEAMIADIPDLPEGTPMPPDLDDIEVKPLTAKMQSFLELVENRRPHQVSFTYRDAPNDTVVFGWYDGRQAAYQWDGKVWVCKSKWTLASRANRHAL